MVKQRVCFVGLYSYSLFKRDTSHVFGGAEVRSWIFADYLSQKSEQDFTYVVFDHGQKRSEKFGRIVVVPHSYYRTYLTRHESISQHFWQTLSHLRNKRTSKGLLTLVMRDLPYLIYKKIRQRFSFLKKPVHLCGEILDPKKYEVYRKVNADIYCVFGVSDFSAELAAFCKVHGKKLVLFLGSDQDLSEDYNPMSKKLNPYGSRGDRCREVIDSADLIIAQTESQKQILKGRFDRSSLLARNAIDFGKIVEPLPSAPPYVLWVGKSDKIKRPDRVLELARMVPEIPFLMIMNRSSGEIFDQILREKSSNVTIVEKVPFWDIESYFAGALAFLSTSIFEGFPNTFLQAGKYGVPIFSWELDPDGFLANSAGGLMFRGEKDTFANEIRKIASNSAHRDQLSKNVQAFVKRKYNLDLSIESLTRALNDLGEHLGP